MKIMCDKDALLESINIALKAVPTRTTLPILECILITCDENGLKLTANDLEIGIETKPIDAEVMEQGCIAIEAKIFSDIVRRLPEGSVTIQVDSNNLITLKCKKSEFKITSQPGIEFPALPEIEKTNMYPVPSNAFKNIIKQTIFAVAADSAKQAMTGELLEIKRDTLTLVGVDGFRIAVRHLPLTEESSNGFKNTIFNDSNPFVFPQNKCIIPGKTLNEISKILPSSNEAIINIYITERHILFEMDTCTVISRLIEGDFINHESFFFEGDYTTRVYVNRELLLNSIERVSLISKDIKKNPVKLNINKKNKIITTSSTDLGNSYDEIDVEKMDGGAIEIAFNPKYLTETLKAIDDEIIRLQFTMPTSPCFIQHEAKVKNYKYLILPLRLK